MTIGKKILNTDYILNDQKLEKISEIKDLGVIVDNRLTFDSHLNYVKNKALKRLNYIIKSTTSLKNPYTLRKLYITLVRPIITYASYIWAPHQQCKIYELEKIQHILLRILAKRSGMTFNRNNHDYTELAKKFNLCTIKSFFDSQDLIFLYKLLNNDLDVPKLLSKLKFKIPARNMRKNNIVFKIDLLSGILNKKSIVSKMCNLANKNSEWCDLTECNKNKFKKTVKEKLYVFK